MNADLSVLLVADSAEGALETCVLLEQAGISKVARARVDAPPAELRAFGADVVLLMLPSTNAADLNALSRVSEAVGVPMIVVTHDDGAGSHELLERGAQEHLFQSELSVRGLARTIRYAMERRRIQHELAALTRRLEVQNERLQRNNADKDILLRIANNDLRVPLGQVHFLVEIMLSDDTLDNPDHRISLTSVLTSCDIMSRSLDDLLSIVDLEEQEPGGVNERLDLVQSVARIAQSLGGIAHERRAAVTFRASDATIDVMGVRDKLNRALDCIILHMIKISDPDTTLLVRASRDGVDGCVELRCTTDSALADHLEQVLAPSDSDALVSANRDFGLGVVVGRRLVEKQGGRLVAIREGVSEIRAVIRLPLPPRR